MIKKLKQGLLLFILGIMLIPNLNVKAASAVVDIYSSNKSPAVGSSITVTVYVKSAAALGSYQYTLTYDSSKLKLTSGELSNVGYSSNSTTKSLSKSFTFKVVGAGSSTISAKGVGVVGFDEKYMSTSVSGVTIKSYVKTYTPVVYSTNNNLKSLSIDGQTLSPAFNKNTTSYTVNLNPEITSIKINASVEDSKAKVSGAGTINVEEGENKINIVVTSEKGTTKTYTIIATVIDKDPINVTIDNKNYTVMKRLTSLKMPNTCTESTIDINNYKVPVYNCDTTNFTLIGLKSDDGTSNLYIYNKDKNTYSPYKELLFQTVTLNILEPDKMIDNYKKTTIKLNDEEVTAYKLSDKSKYSLLYGINIETGKASWYMYEETENTIQIYNLEEIKKLQNKIKNADILIYSFAGIIVLLSTLLIIVAIKKSPKEKKKKEIEKPIKKDKQSKLEKTQDKKEEIVIEEIKEDKKDILKEKQENIVEEIKNEEKPIKEKKLKKKKDIFKDW